MRGLLHRTSSCGNFHRRWVVTEKLKDEEEMLCLKEVLVA